MRHTNPKGIDIGLPEEHPGVIIEPVQDPVPREMPEPVKNPEPVRVPVKEPVPA